MTVVKSLRDVRIASLTGHIALIKANTPTRIPDAILEEALMQGCVPTDETPVLKQEQEPEEPSPQDDGMTFEMALDSALIALINQDDDEDFTKDGRPKVLSAEREMPEGFKRPTTSEIVQRFELLQEHLEHAS